MGRRFSALCRNLFLLKTWFELIPANTATSSCSNSNESEYSSENSVRSYHVCGGWLFVWAMWNVDASGSWWACDAISWWSALLHWHARAPRLVNCMHIMGNASPNRRSQMSSTRSIQLQFAADPHDSVGCKNCSIKARNDEFFFFSFSFRQPKMLKIERFFVCIRMMVVSFIATAERRIRCVAVSVGLAKPFNEINFTILRCRPVKCRHELDNQACVTERTKEWKKKRNMQVPTTRCTYAPLYEGDE